MFRVGVHIPIWLAMIVEFVRFCGLLVLWAALSVVWLFQELWDLGSWLRRKCRARNAL